MTNLQLIDSKQAEIKKLELKLSRIDTALATGKNPYYYRQTDKTYTEKEIESAKKRLIVLQARAAVDVEKAASRNVPAIDEFINNWKNRVFENSKRKFDDYYDDKKALREAYKNAYKSDNFAYPDTEEIKKFDTLQKHFKIACLNPMKYDTSDFEGECAAYAEKNLGIYYSIQEFVQYSVYEDACEKLHKVLDKEGIQKYDYIIERTNEIVGTIQDAAGLTVSPLGEIDGIIIGSKGKARINTISAGGYNIQCFHFRVLVKEVRG